MSPCQNQSDLNIIIIFFSILFSSIVNSQPYNPYDIEIRKGTLAIDMHKVNSHIFIYTLKGIMIYNENSLNEPDTIIEFNQSNYFGKFNPVYYNDRLHFGAARLMTYNAQSQILFILFPDLVIKGINVNAPFNTIVSYNPLSHEPPAGLPILPSYFYPLHHASILKYDNNNDRLYWLIYGRDTIKSVGNFHTVSRYFAILDYNELTSSLDCYYTELVDNTGNYYDKNISDIVFNTSITSPQCNYYYLSKLNRIEVWQITDNNQVIAIDTVIVDTNIYGYLSNGTTPEYYKFSKMLYINNADVHQIIALPYRFPSSDLEEGQFPMVYVLDGDWAGDGDITHWTFQAPSEKVTDGTFIYNSQHDSYDLVLSYAQDPGEYHLDSSDIAVYRRVGNVYNYKEKINTESSTKISEYDINTSFVLLPGSMDGETILMVGKKDGVCKIEYDEIEDTYSSSSVLDGESNFFRLGHSDLSSHYFINSVSNVVEVFLNSQKTGQIAIGHPVYGVAGNSDGSKLYFYNTLQSQNTGLFIYVPGEGAPININADGNGFNDIETSVGDCIFNPYQNHFLISTYGSPATVRVIDGMTNDLIRNIQLTHNGQDAHYAKEMYISPEGKLYVMVDMHQESSGPKVLEFNAYYNGDLPAYSLLNSHEVNIGDTLEALFAGYSAHFCYNSFNRTVYLTVHKTELTLDPYNTVVNSTFDFDPPTDGTNGKLLGIKDGNLVTNMGLNFPGALICPGTDYQQLPTAFEGKVYIIGKYFYVFDPDLQTDAQLTGLGSFNDITYSAYHDKMYAIKDTYNDSPDHRVCEIYAIHVLGGQLDTTLMGALPGQFSSITYNPYDNKVYLYRKTDARKLGDTPAQIFYFDPETPVVIDSLDLTFGCRYPELDHNPDHHYYFYNITEPYIDPINNQIYFPNGSHSSVTRLDFLANEIIPLDTSGFSWLSFPRLDRPENTIVNTVLNNGIDTTLALYQEDSYLQNLPPTQIQPVMSQYDGTEWSSVTGLTNIDSERGYKLQLLYEAGNAPEKQWLHLYGDALPATDELTVYYQYDNWAGYWLYESQSPFDAFPSDVMEELSSIKHQDWICAAYGTPDGQEPYYWACACHEGRVELRYGDMVILKTRVGAGSFNYQWQRYGSPIQGEERPETAYYTYTEQSDYTPYLIELDSTSQLPSEIGAFVNDTCVGANTVVDGDTLVLVPGYTEGMIGEVTFELYYDSLKSGGDPVWEYYVEDPGTRKKVRRTIHTKEKRDFFLISFSHEDADSSSFGLLPMSVVPNPAKDRFIVEISLSREGETLIELYDLFGRRCKSYTVGWLPSGDHRIEMSLSDGTGKILAGGLYMVKARCGQYLGQSKLIILK